MFVLSTVNWIECEGLDGWVAGKVGLRRLSENSVNGEMGMFRRVMVYEGPF